MTDNETKPPADEGRLEQGVGRPVPERADVGDTVACDVRQPHQQTLAMTLETPEAAAHANKLLADPRSGWRKVAGCSECAWGKVLGCWRCGSR